MFEHFGYCSSHDRDDAILLEKDDMRRRGLASPNDDRRLAGFPRVDWAEERRIEEKLQGLKRRVV